MTTSLVVRVHAYGGVEALRVEEVEVGTPGPGEVLLRQTAIGLNFIDTYHRSGLYPIDPLPAVLGSEGAGVVEAVGPGVEDFAVGDRVAYGLGRGAYAERRLIEAERLVALPAAISDEAAAAMMLKGLTAQYLVRRTCALRSGDVVLVHAAAGGVGTILCQWASALGARVFGTAGSAAKVARALEHGCEAAIDYRREDVVARVGELTDGRGVDVVYDGVGKATFDISLECLTRFGLLVTFGNASGPVGPVDVLRLTPKGIFLTRPSLITYAAEREDLVAMAADLFAAVEAGQVRIEIGQRFALREVQAAHRALEGRETVGSTILLP